MLPHQKTTRRALLLSLALLTASGCTCIAPQPPRTWGERDDTPPMNHPQDPVAVAEGDVGGSPRFLAFLLLQRMSHPNP